MLRRTGKRGSPRRQAEAPTDTHLSKITREHARGLVSWPTVDNHQVPTLDELIVFVHIPKTTGETMKIALFNAVGYQFNPEWFASPALSHPATPPPLPTPRPTVPPRHVLLCTLVQPRVVCHTSRGVQYGAHGAYRYSAAAGPVSPVLHTPAHPRHELLRGKPFANPLLYHFPPFSTQSGVQSLQSGAIHTSMHTIMHTIMIALTQPCRVGRMDAQDHHQNDEDHGPPHPWPLPGDSMNNPSQS